MIPSFSWTHLNPPSSSSFFPTLENHLNVMSSVPKLLATSLLQAKNIGIAVTPGKKPPPWRHHGDLIFFVEFLLEMSLEIWLLVDECAGLKNPKDSSRTDGLQTRICKKSYKVSAKLQPHHTMHHKSYPKNWQQAHKEQTKLNKKSWQSDAE